MANTITEKIIANGPKNLILEYQIVGDGTGEESGTVLVDHSALGASGDLAVKKHYSALSGFSAALSWDATAPVHLFSLEEGEGGVDWTDAGGVVKNNAGTGKTGDIKITTVGLGAGDKGTVRLWLVKS